MHEAAVAQSLMEVILQEAEKQHGPDLFARRSVAAS